MSVQVTFDCVDPNAQARWWAARLDYVVEKEPEFVAGLLDQGVLGPDDVVEIDGVLAFADAAAAHDPIGERPRLFFQRVPEAKATKNRLHLDIRIPPEELEHEVEMWTAAGAAFVEYRSHPGHRWAVMTDPEGNEFCLH